MSSFKATAKRICFRALKESGYESDSILVFKRREDTGQQLSPSEQKEAYKTIQKGGDVPLHGLRRVAPERPKGNLLLSVGRNGMVKVLN